MPREFFRFGPGALLKLMMLEANDDGGSGGDSNSSAGDTGTSSGDVNSDSWLATQPPEVQAVIRNLRKENGDHRAENKRLKDAEQKRQTEADKAAQQKLEADKQFEQLAGTYKAKVDELTPKAELADSLLERITTQNTARIEKLPKQMQTLVPKNYNPVELSEWLDANADVLTKPIVPNLNAGAGGDKGDGKGKVDYTSSGW